MDGKMIAMFRRLALLVVTALSLGAIALPALAQEIAPEHLALARKFIDLTDRASIYEQSLINTGVETMTTILQHNPEISDALEKAITTTLDTYKDRKGELLDQFARLYASRFSMEELQQIVDFYSSPVGQKLTDATVDLNTDVQTVMKVWESNLRAEFYAKVKAELKAAGYDI
jgi:hypothetical protein